MDASVGVLPLERLLDCAEAVLRRGTYAEGMQLKVLFFGVLRDRFGLEEELQEFPGRTVADLLRYYRAVSPELRELWDLLAVAVNQQYAVASAELRDGDEVALLPPVSGGLKAGGTACTSR